MMRSLLFLGAQLQLAVYFEYQVDRAAVAARDNPRPAFSRSLLASKPDARIVVEFVVDTTGRADTTTFKVLSSPHKSAASAVRGVLPRLRFAPAELKGRKVRQIVQMPFRIR
jgi:hypothetical protein